ncbi:MAG TPA: cupin domain-containing protein [Gemmatimonadales bacterium]|nr:cupin domain-containing protein [Gemmatimonadales bacterium]
MPEVLSLTDLVRVQPGAVVSRALVKKKAGTVTVFGFDAGEGLSEHTAPYEALVVLLDGEAEVTVEGAPHLLRAGQLITLPAGRPHALRAITAFTMLLIMIRE